jgi:hypothetical protein
MLQEGVSSVRGARLVNKLDIILLAFSDVSSNMWSDFVSVAVELKVCVVSNDEDWVCCAFKQIIPVLKSSDNCQEFSIVDRVLLLRCREGLGVIPTGAEDRISSLILQFLVCLEENCACCILQRVYFQNKLPFCVWGYKDGF